MKKILFTAALLMGLGSGSALAGSTEAALGGGLGGVLGAVIGQQVGGSTGAVIGAGVGGAAGAVIAHDRNDDHDRDRRSYRRDDNRRWQNGQGYRNTRYGTQHRDHKRSSRGHGYFCPPGQAKKGRC